MAEMCRGVYRTLSVSEISWRRSLEMWNFFVYEQKKLISANWIKVGKQGIQFTLLIIYSLYEPWDDQFFWA